ncbi:uncharacterized protein KRP23_3088 [Phytophthora ramorum]|uniref:uncharacterized protein n=1 Tax=Phytophthora ramorum TaxID=164328 RepID=UPI003098FE9D|nr:hypothetical protein KRP23_3088 [Phytophthora ramorum]
MLQATVHWRFFREERETGKKADKMASMSLDFILCESLETSTPRTRTQRRKKTKKDATNRESTLSAEPSDQNAVADKADSRDKPLEPDRHVDWQQHVRRLQNVRQRRYRERKKSTASALQTTAEELYQENAALETDILQHFKS